MNAVMVFYMVFNFFYQIVLSFLATLNFEKSEFELEIERDKFQSFLALF